MSDDIQPFRIEVSDADLDDLTRRLEATRWANEEPVDDWSQGTPLHYLQEVCAYWAEKYNWRDREARLNAFAQFRTSVDVNGWRLVAWPDAQSRGGGIHRRELARWLRR